MRTRGFTLLELLLVAAIATALALVAVVGYREYIVRAQTAQSLLNIDHITTVVRIENRTDYPDLEIGALPGKAPPRLAGLLPDSDFAGLDGMTFWFIKAPAGLFASYPTQATYALLASAPDADSLTALYALRRGLPHADADAPWIDAQSFAFPLEPLAVTAITPVPDPTKPPTCSQGTSFGSVATQAMGNRWRASATVVGCSREGNPLDLENASVQVSRVVSVRDGSGKQFDADWGTVVEKMSGGYYSLSMSGLTVDPGYTVVSVTFKVLGVIDWSQGSGPSSRWDGKTSSITIAAPT